MANHRLSDAEIEALIEGAPVDGAPAELTELMSALRFHAESSPSVPVSGALNELIATGASAAATVAGTDVISIRRGRPSRRAEQPR